MDVILDSIRIDIADGASDAERAHGALACRSLADTLDGPIVPAEPTIPTDSEPPADPIIPAVLALAPLGASSPLASNPFAGLTADQILDLPIAKLRAALGEDAPPPPSGPPFRVTLVTVPRRR